MSEEKKELESEAEAEVVEPKKKGNWKKILKPVGATIGVGALTVVAFMFGKHTQKGDQSTEEQPISNGEAPAPTDDDPTEDQTNN